MHLNPIRAPRSESMLPPMYEVRLPTTGGSETWISSLTIVDMRGAHNLVITSLNRVVSLLLDNKLAPKFRRQTLSSKLRFVPIATEIGDGDIMFRFLADGSLTWDEQTKELSIM